MYLEDFWGRGFLHVGDFPTTPAPAGSVTGRLEVKQTSCNHEGESHALGVQEQKEEKG